MKLKWKRNFNGKVFNFEVDYLISSKVNHTDLKMPKIYLEKDYLQDAVKSAVEEIIIDSAKKKEEIMKQNQSLDDKSKIKNHFRNVCFRKKFNTLSEYLKYLSAYYLLPETTILTYVEEDIPYIKKTVGLK